MSNSSDFSLPSARLVQEPIARTLSRTLANAASPPPPRTPTIFAVACASRWTRKRRGIGGLWATSVSLALAMTAHGAVTEGFSIDDRHFSALGGGPYLFLNPGYQLVLEGPNEDGEPTTLTITTLNETKTISLPTAGGERKIVTRVIEEREYLAGQLVDVSRLYQARSIETSDIYHFGEVDETYENGRSLGSQTVWEAGVNGAQPGIIMPGTLWWEHVMLRVSKAAMPLATPRTWPPA